MAFDSAAYGRLLAEVQPVLIETPEDHERLLQAAEQLMDKGEAVSPEEEKLLTLLVLLIEAYESAAEEEDEEETSIEPPKPYQTLRRLADARGMDVQDLCDVFGNPQLARDALEGRRKISRGQAKQLGRLFQVPAKLFEE